MNDYESQHIEPGDSSAVAQVDEARKKKKISNETPASSLESELLSDKETAAKYDMVNFAKLKPAQQLLKRLEMLNKPAPTTTVSSAKSVINKTATTATPEKSATVPHLIIDSSCTLKVPLVMRQRYLKYIFDDGKTSFPSLEIAAKKAAEQEKSIYDRSKNKTIYINLAANLIKSLRDQHAQQIKEQQQNSSNIVKPIVNIPTKLVNQKPPQKQIATYSHEAFLSGPKATRVSYSINKVKQIEVKDLTGSKVNLNIELYTFLNSGTI